MYCMQNSLKTIEDNIIKFMKCSINFTYYPYFYTLPMVNFAKIGKMFSVSEFISYTKVYYSSNSKACKTHGQIVQ